MAEQKEKKDKEKQPYKQRLSLRTRLLLFLSFFLLAVVFAFSHLALSAIIKVGKNTQIISAEALRVQSEEYLRQITDDAAKENDEVFSNIMHQAKNISEYAAEVFSNPNIFRPGEYWQAEKQMLIGENGQYLNSATGTASVFVPNFVRVDDELNSHLESMAYLDFVAQNIFLNNEIVKAVYMSSQKQATRYYPNVHLGMVVPPDFKITNRDWYKKMSPENNPERKAILSEIYLDATGNGLMVTAVAPVYVDSEFIGGIGLDITLEDMKRNIEQEKLLANGFLFFVNKKADSVILPARGYANIVKQTPGKDEWKIDKESVYPGFAEALGKIAIENNGFMPVMINNEEYFVAFSRMENTGWAIGSIVKTADILSVVKKMQTEIDRSINNYVFYYILPTGFIIFIFIFIFVFVFSRHITKPLLKMNKIVHRIAGGKWQGEKIIVKSRDEIGELADSFNQMASELKGSKEKLEKYSQNLEKEVGKKTGELNKALDSVQGDKNDLERQRLATLNILDDVFESKGELEELNQKLEARGSELAALKNLSDDLSSVLDIEEVVVVANSYFDKFIDFSTINYLIVNPAQEGSIIYNTYCKNAVSEKFIKESKNHLGNFLSLQKNTNLKAAVKIIKNIEPKYYGIGLDNTKNIKPFGYEYYFLSINEKQLGVIQVVHAKKRKIGEDELSLLRAIITTLSLSIDRLQTLVLAQHSKTASLVESLTDGVIMFNDKEEIVLMNPAFSAYTGLSREFFNMKDLYRLLSEQKIQKMIVKALKKGETSHINEVELVRHFYEMFITPVRDNKEQIVGGAIIFHDITFLKEIDKMKTEFVAVASHQLRTPLTAIKLFTDMMLRGETGKINKEQKEYLENVNESTERMVRLVNDLLNVTRIESGRLRVEPQEIDLKNLLNNIIAESKPLAATRQQIISLEDKGKKLLKVKLDQNLVRQVFHNLIVNAIRYSPERTGKISVVLSKDDKKTFTVAVHDNGMGIPKEAQKRIFEKFYRADNAVKSITEGTGLGLYVSKMIVESSGGKIWFESAKGKGTSFYVRMPIKGMKKKEGERGLAIS